MDKKVLVWLSSFRKCWNYLLRLLMALGRSVLRIDEALLFETFCSLKIRNFGYTPSWLQLVEKLMSSFSSFCLYISFSNFRKSLTVTFPCFHAMLLYMFAVFLKSPKLKNSYIFWTTRFNHMTIQSYDL